MSTSVERVFNNPYLLADIMRHVAKVDKAHNVLSTLCVSRAFRNPHVIREALRSITYIYKPLREKVTGDSVMSCIDVDHVSGAVERSEVKIDGLLCDGMVYFSEHGYILGSMMKFFESVQAVELLAPGQFNILVDDVLFHIHPRTRLWTNAVEMQQIGPYKISMNPLMGETGVNSELPCADVCRWLEYERTSTEKATGCSLRSE